MYQFTDDCRTGIDEIDREHQELFELINRTTELVNSGKDSYIEAKKFLRRLEDYALTHFVHEENYMEKIHDKELARQKREHEIFREKVAGYQIEELSPEDGDRVMGELLAFMARWLYRHILGSDIMIGKFTEETTEDIFVFSDRYKTGIKFVDEEHEKLFEIIGRIADLLQEQLLHDKFDAIVQIIDELREYTITHFSDEERYMESIGYEGIKTQRIAHRAFVERLNEINLGEVDDNQQEYLEDLIHFLAQWLVSHILNMDKKIPRPVGSDS
jgi:hemerythrin